MYQRQIEGGLRIENSEIKFVLSANPLQIKYSRVLTCAVMTDVLMLSHLEHLQVGELQFAELLQTFLEDK